MATKLAKGEVKKDTIDKVEMEVKVDEEEDEGFVCLGEDFKANQSTPQKTIRESEIEDSSDESCSENNESFEVIQATDETEETMPALEPVESDNDDFERLSIEEKTEKPVEMREECEDRQEKFQYFATKLDYSNEENVDLEAAASLFKDYCVKEQQHLSNFEVVIGDQSAKSD